MLTIWRTMEKQLRVDENDDNEKVNPDMTAQQRPPVAQVWIFVCFVLLTSYNLRQTEQS